MTKIRITFSYEVKKKKTSDKSYIKTEITNIATNFLENRQVTTVFQNTEIRYKNSETVAPLYISVLCNVYI